MKEYNSLINFMLDLGTAVQDYLRESQRTESMSLTEFIQEWLSNKSCYDMCCLRSDIRSYLRKHARGDYTVDDLFFYYDIGFVRERFGCSESQLLIDVLGALDVYVGARRKEAFKKYFGWLRFE